MVINILNLTRWEWFKSRRRLMPWILLAVAVIIGQIPIWIAYSAFHNDDLQTLFSGSINSYSASAEVNGELVTVEMTCVELVEGRMPPELGKFPVDERRELVEDFERFRNESCGGTLAKEEYRAAFVLPSAITEAFESSMGLLPILIMILAASIIGSEYGMGTLRTVLTKGTGRWPLLSSKLLLVLLTVAVGLVVLAVTAIVASLIAAVIPPSEEGGFADSGKWSEMVVTFGKALYGLAPYVALSALFAVLTQSSAISIAASLGYYVLELIVTPLLRINETLEKLTDFILGGSVNNWMQVAFVEVEVNSEGGFNEQTDLLQSFLVILAYIVVLSTVAFWIFQRRDIAGAKGE